ncbi:hypothetical protein E4Q23_16125 [Candidatus Accumulibacter phosphatis]|uniref:PD-(D/E)XK endonuclease-like domain-containing protein n=1 Tax=Candidatus Accumulibacter phosphatis TaxID=327160 RepID=A0ABX1U1U1_9PROT|nr:hypothetical protein [Candidatus Accumulibacter phosphatis]NMQ29152.1 hypothetical protein [Candidatus Accumulibacter phosphatis]
MIDLNHQPKFHEKVTALVDAALQAENAARERRRYLGASRLGIACERALQFEYADAPVDAGAEFAGRTLRIFDVGHALEELAIRWLRLAGFELHTRRKEGGQFGFSVANGRIQGHVDGIFSDGPAELGLSYPMLFECKTMNDRNWKACVKSGVAVSKPVYAAQIAVYQAYLESSIPGISAHPALFTAINKDTQELWCELVPFDGGLAQRMSDRAVRVIQATEAGEQLPRIAIEPGYYECKYCAWAHRCWRSS